MRDGGGEKKSNSIIHPLAYQKINRLFFISAALSALHHTQKYDDILIFLSRARIALSDIVMKWVFRRNETPFFCFSMLLCACVLINNEKYNRNFSYNSLNAHEKKTASETAENSLIEVLFLTSDDEWITIKVKIWKKRRSRLAWEKFFAFFFFLFSIVLDNTFLCDKRENPLKACVTCQNKTFHTRRLFDDTKGKSITSVPGPGERRTTENIYE